jgi:putative nucleotidyltransferase with HDIG domain
MTAPAYSSYFDIFADVSKSIHSGSDTHEILDRIVSSITKITHSKGSIFWVINTRKKQIETKISHGFDYRSLSLVTYDVLARIFNPVRRETVFIEDARYDERIPDLERLGKKRVGSINGLFFEIDPSHVGILAVYFTGTRRLSHEELKLVTALGEQGAISLQKALYYDEKMIATLRQFIEGLVIALEAKDKQTHGHSVNVAQFARITAMAMELTGKTIEMVYHGALLHDIGKIGIEDFVLDKLGILNVKEMDIIRKHPIIGSKIIHPLTFFKGIEPFILYHHERYDGSGYPMGLKKEEIPLGARIIGVCDAFETMISGREHIGKKSFCDAVAAIQKGANLYFDPEVVKALFKGIRAYPELTGYPDEVEQCREQLSQDLDVIAMDNLIRRRLCTDSMNCF